MAKAAYLFIGHKKLHTVYSYAQRTPLRSLKLLDSPIGTAVALNIP
jgi:hypothetical protein